MAGNTSRQNGEKGGRPPGRKNEKTLEREAQLELFRQCVFEAFDPLINAQISLARGVSYLFKEDLNDDGTKGKPILVTDPDEIRAYLAEDYNALSTAYYYITTEKPENAALKDLWDRSIGKPAQMLELPPDSDLGAVVGFVFKRNEKNNAEIRPTAKQALGRSPDVGDTFLIRMYFELIKDAADKPNAPYERSVRDMNMRQGPRKNVRRGV